MIQDATNQLEEIYVVNNKEYKVITKSIENSQDEDKLYDILCKFAISKL